MNRSLAAPLCAATISAALLSGCMIPPASYGTSVSQQQYAPVSPGQADMMRQLIAAEATGEKARRLVRIVDKAEGNQPLAPNEVQGLRILMTGAEQQQAARVADERKALAERDRKQQMATDALRRQEVAQADEIALRKSRYRSNFDAIASPQDGQAFTEQYAGVYDPDHLVKGAMRKGYEAGARSAQGCVDRANRAIETQKEIGAASGYVDKGVMYEAGAMIVRCRRQLAEYRSKLS